MTKAEQGGSPVALSTLSRSPGVADSTTGKHRHEGVAWAGARGRDPGGVVHSVLNSPVEAGGTAEATWG